MGRVGTLLVSIAAALVPGRMPAAAQSGCQLCAPAPAEQAKPARPIHIDIETTLDFATAAHTDLGAGTIQLDARTGQRSFSGLSGLGGGGLRGTVTITGEPFHRVRIDLPAVIDLRSTMGARAEVSDLRTDLPPDPRIGADGRLVFQFGGRFSVRDGAAGDFRGRIQIRAEYQ